MKRFFLNPTFLTVLTSCISFLLGYLCYLIFNEFDNFSTDSKVEIAGILVNIVIGVLIVFVIQKKLSDDRGVKDYLINEVCEIKDDYGEFLNQLYKNHYNPSTIINWFKIMSMKLEHIRYFLINDLKIEKEGLSNKSNNRELQQLITGSDEFNNQFSQDFYRPSSLMKANIEVQFKELKHALISTIIKINRA